MNKQQTIKDAITDLETYLWHRYDSFCFMYDFEPTTKEEWEKANAYETRKTINELKDQIQKM